MIKCIYPNWSAPKNIRAFTTTRQGGVSLPPFDSLNLGRHVNDDLVNVIENRARLMKAESIPNPPFWLNQTHSTDVIDMSSLKIQASAKDSRLINEQIFTADGSYSHQAGCVSAVLTADCLPVLFCSLHGDEVASAHAGWRGLCDGILESSTNCFKCDPSQIVVWLGPAIGPEKFEVGQEVKEQFEANDPDASQAFTLINPSQKKYLANLYLLAKQRLVKLGITRIYGGEYCTYSQQDLFYSYRRDKQTGRMASIIWFE